MIPRLLLAVLLATFAATSASAAPTARFTARPVQGSTCVAPCAVHFDAIGTGANETTDPTFTRPFHSLLFQWDFGDPNSGTWALSGQPKNTATGGIAGHIYTNPGSYLVTLRVTNPSGELNTTTRSVTVVDPANAFTPANTFCFANSASNWSGCPLNCAGGDDNCTVTNSWNTLVTGGDNCSGSGDCANADAGPRRILLRRGDTFNGSGQVVFSGSATSPGLVAAFGAGADPIISHSGRNDWGTGWTVTGLEVRAGQPIFVTNFVDNATFYRINAQFGGTCIEEPPIDLTRPGTTRVGRLHAYIDVNCTATNSNTGYASWPGADYVLWMGGTFNKNGGQYASLRSHHMQHYLIQHTRWINAGTGMMHWQFRAYDEFAAFTPAQEANRFVLVSDNLVESPGDNSFFTVRVCVDSGCNCGEGGAQCGGPAIGAGKIVPVSDFIFERNFFKYGPGGPGNRIGVFELQGGDFTVRNNIVDFQGGLGNYSSSLVVATGEPREHTSGSSPSSNFHVDNNTVYFNTPYTSRFNFADTRGPLGDGCAGGCFSRNNLLVAPGFNGTLGDHPSFTRANNAAVGSNPFIGPVPGQGSTTKSSFQLGANASGVADAGSTFVPTTTRDGWVFEDAFGNCRSGSTGPWDIGAHERGGVRCPSTSQPPPPPAALLPPTLLQPQ